jgi:hypothetical protein
MNRRATIEAEKRRRANAGSAVVINEAPDFFEWVEKEVSIENPHKVGASIIPFKLWDEQKKYASLLHNELQTITLKARQLGISWVTIVYALWLCVFYKGVTVLVFSKDKDAAEEIIRRARGVFKRLKNPPVKEQGKENQKSILFSNGSRFKAFAATKNAGTSFTATLLIVDEFDKMEFGRDLYTSIRPTIADGGRIAMIFTAFGEDNAGRLVWELAGQAASKIVRFFIPWHARPGRTQEWYDTEAMSAISMAHHRQEYPATPEEALGFTDLDARLVRDIEQWNTLGIIPSEIPTFLPCVLAIDAGVTSDLFAVASAVWHPIKRIPIIRDIKTWNPIYTEGKQVDFSEPQNWVIDFVRRNRILKVVYDPYQLVGFGQELQKIVNAEEFTQGTARVSADTSLKNRINQGLIGHLNDPELALHIQNANIKVFPDSNKLRIIKRRKDLKIDLSVVTSMAAWTLTSEFAFDIDNSAPVSTISHTPHDPLIQRANIFRGMPDSLYKRIGRKR